MLKPKALKKGDTVGLVAPSSPVGGVKSVKFAMEKIDTLGFRAKAAPNCCKEYGYLAGSDSDRADDINRMFADPEVDAIICLMGGYGTPRILDQLDYPTICRNPKLFVGYSDITGLHLALNRICRLVTIHGPLPIPDRECYTEDINFSKTSFWNTITSTDPLGEIRNPQGEAIQCLTGGKASGMITGGNLSLVTATLGTPYEIEAEDKILFLEDVGERPYRIDRMLTQLRLAGKFEKCRGIVLGSWTDCRPDRTGDLSLKQIFEDVVAPCGKPVIYNLRAGHCVPKVTLPLGVQAILDADNGTLEVTESAVV